jgi:hypothetical protein
MRARWDYFLIKKYGVPRRPFFYSGERRVRYPETGTVRRRFVGLGPFQPNISTAAAPWHSGPSAQLFLKPNVNELTRPRTQNRLKVIRKHHVAVTDAETIMGDDAFFMYTTDETDESFFNIQRTDQTAETLLPLLLGIDIDRCSKQSSK